MMETDKLKGVLEKAAKNLGARNNVENFVKMVKQIKAKKRRHHCQVGIKALVPVAVLGSMIRGAKAYLELAKQHGVSIDERVVIDLTIAEPIYKKMIVRNEHNWQRWKRSVQASEEERENIGESETQAKVYGEGAAMPIATLGDAFKRIRPAKW